MNEHAAYKKLINIKYDPKRETGLEFISRFEKIVRQYESYCKSQKYRHDAKRKLFVNAVEQTIPSVINANVVTQNPRGMECDNNALKAIVLQVVPKVLPRLNAMNAHTGRGEMRSGSENY